MSATRPGLAAFNAMDDAAARERLLVCLDVPRWADAVASPVAPTTTSVRSRPR